MRTKYNARRTYSVLCERFFDSKAEAQRGEDLALLQKAGLISDLEYQKRFVLSEKPRVTITIDFAYKQRESGYQYYEDVKGILTRDCRTKLAWLREKHSIEVCLVS